MSANLSSANRMMRLILSRSLGKNPTDDNGAEVTGYEVRVRAGSTGFTNWEIALFSLTLDAVYLATVVAALGLIVPGVRILLELEVRAVNLNGGGQISRMYWNWPVDVWAPSVPTSFIVTPQLQIPGIIGIDVHLSWDFPADTGNTFIESYEYRYKESAAAHSIPIMCLLLKDQPQSQG